MELAQCIQNIYAHPCDHWIEPETQHLLFKKGNVYPVFQESDYWMAQDEDGERHIIADPYEDISEDPWFVLHFRAL